MESRVVQLVFEGDGQSFDERGGGLLLGGKLAQQLGGRGAHDGVCGRELGAQDVGRVRRLEGRQRAQDFRHGQRRRVRIIEHRAQKHLRVGDHADGAVASVLARDGGHFAQALCQTGDRLPAQGDDAPAHRRIDAPRQVVKGLLAQVLRRRNPRKRDFDFGRAVVFRHTQLAQPRERTLVTAIGARAPDCDGHLKQLVNLRGMRRALRLRFAVGIEQRLAALKQGGGGARVFQRGQRA